ncbi:MAG: xanthine dehydrogenase accessory protein XdhC [Bacteriovorax sp.]|nr:xanthine dehydrogenase accessory protein XdhC [Bacteriovorax sp.]
MNEDLLAQISKLKENASSFVIVTMVSVRGSAPQEIGARIIVNESGLNFGTIGGGKIEAKAIRVAQELLLKEDIHQFVEWNLQTDVGMTCGGVVGLFFEKILPISNWKIAVFGAGHVSQELIRLLIKLDCEVTCIDPRAEWLAKLPEHFRLKKIQLDDMKSALSTLSPKTFIVSVTMGHAFDLPILLLALSDFNFPYVGAIGSESKARVIKNDLKKNGINENLISKLHCPIGEPVGNNHPVEIAISIVAQLLKVRDSF